MLKKIPKFEIVNSRCVIKNVNTKLQLQFCSKIISNGYSTVIFLSCRLCFMPKCRRKSLQILLSILTHLQLFIQSSSCMYHKIFLEFKTVKKHCTWKEGMCWAIPVPCHHSEIMVTKLSPVWGPICAATSVAPDPRPGLLNIFCLIWLI